MPVWVSEISGKTSNQCYSQFQPHLFITNYQPTSKALLSVKPYAYGFYGISAYNQLNSRLSNGQAAMFLGSQGRSGYVITPNFSVGAELNIKPFRSGFYTLIGVEKGTLRTRIEFQHPAISVNADYPSLLYHVQRNSLSLGIGTSNIESKLFGKSFKCEFSLSYVLQLLNPKKSYFLTVNGKKTSADTGIVLVDEKNNSGDIKLYNNIYYYKDIQHEINLYLGIRKRFKKVIFGAGINYRISLKKVGILFTEYYPSNQSIPSVQMNDIQGSALGLRTYISFPIVNLKNEKLLSFK